MGPTEKGGVRRHFSYANVMSTLAVFLVIAGGSALAAKVNSSKDIAKGSVKNSDVKKETLTSNRLKNGKAVRGDDVVDDSLTGTDVDESTLTGVPLAPDSVTATEIAADSVGSSEIASGIVGADELDTIHEHVSAVTNVTDATAHDGAYGFATTNVSCGVGEDLLSVSIDWIDDNGHNETVFGGVNSISRAEPDTANVRASYDGGGGAADPAQFQAVATCIF